MKRHAARRFTRGAALVEAVAVIPVFILFFVGMVYVFRFYAAKMDAMSGARAHTMAYALGGCQGDYQTVAHTAKGGATTAPPSGVNGATPDMQPKDGNAQSMETQSKTSTLTLAHTASKVTGTVNVGSFLSAAKKDPASTSTLMCGEKPQDGGLKGLIKYAINLFI